MFRGARLRDSGSGSGSVDPCNNILSDPEEMVSWPETLGHREGRGQVRSYMQWILTSHSVLRGVGEIVNFRSDLDGDIYHDNDGYQSSNSTPHCCCYCGWWREWNGKVTQIFIPSLLHFILCEVYFQEAISIYKVDFNLSIDLCFQDVLRKLVPKDGES